MPSVGFIGAGTVGTALAVSLSGRGYQLAAVASKTHASAAALAARIQPPPPVCDAQGAVDRCELVFLTTPDDLIGPVANSLAWHAGQAVVHCSGAASTDVLEAARAAGAAVGAFHPLQTFASVNEAIENLPGSAFAIEADGPLLTILEQMARDLSGTPIRLGPGDKTIYHTAAVLVSNYTVALMAAATELWGQFGVTTPDATQSLLPLLQGTINNIRKIGLPGCLTGPIARGDLGTVEKHLEALEARAPELLGIYCELGLRAVPVALAKGKIDTNQARALEKALADHLHTSSQVSTRGLNRTEAN
ncbi:MAG: DUF2520 domain-containing protein [Chloroflexota bacterium]|nr:MAG: DUF2520 domain-containing protein [Chloroflexota bacterium]